MTPQILLEKLRNLLATEPGLAGRGPYGPEQFAWLGRASALIALWDKSEAIQFKVAVNCIAGNLDRRHNHSIIATTIHRAITLLEETLPSTSQQVFGPGAVYDFFRALNEVVSSAGNGVFIVDPYMDPEVFDGYLSSLGSGKNVRLLFTKYAESMRVALVKYKQQYACQIEARTSHSIHDRLVFIDDSECWVLGASIKNAAGRKPTYLAPLSPDVVQSKLAFYETIWASGTAI